MNLIPNEDKETELTEKEEMLLDLMDFTQRINQVTAAYTVYALLNPNSKKLVSKELFLNLYDENMGQFFALMVEEEDDVQPPLFH